MNKNQFNSWEEIFNFCSGKFNNYDNNSSETESDNSENSNNGSSNNESSSQCNNCKPDGRQAQADESARNADSDIPGGFQDIPPQVLLVIGELLGNVIAGNIPFNVQNVLGNWLQLVGQAIEVFNAQQQYYQGGPGRYYSYVYRNVANPFCTSESDESQTSIIPNKNNSTTYTNNGFNYNSQKNNTKNAEFKKTRQRNTSNDEIKQLKECILSLSTQIKSLKKEIEELKRYK